MWMKIVFFIDEICQITIWWCNYSTFTLLMRLYFACWSAQEFPGGDQHFWKWPQNHGTWSHNFVGSQSQVLSPPVHLLMLKPCFSLFIRYDEEGGWSLVYYRANRFFKKVKVMILIFFTFYIYLVFQIGFA